MNEHEGRPGSEVGNHRVDVGEPPERAPSEGDPTPWRELDRRSPVVTALVAAGIALGSAIPILLGIRGEGHPFWQVVLVVGAGLVVVVGIAALGDRLRWRHTRFRITDERVELRFSWVVHRFRSVPRDRIRTVDLTANPLLRLFGVVKVQIGTGQRAGNQSQLVLSPLDRAQAEQLRRELLTRAVPAPPTALAAGHSQPPVEHGPPGVEHGRSAVGHDPLAAGHGYPAAGHGMPTGLSQPVAEHDPLAAGHGQPDTDLGQPAAGHGYPAAGHGMPTGLSQPVAEHDPLAAGHGQPDTDLGLPAVGRGYPVAGYSQPIAELDWSWIRYAPISVSTPILGVAAFGGLLQISDWFGLRRTVVGEAGDLLRGLPLLVMIGLLVLVGVVVGVLGSLGLFAELWSGYRLTREDGMLRVRRGLLTTRSLSLDERRLRGVEVAEPLGARLFGAARVDAVATGLRTQGDKERSDPKTLLPPAPRAEALRVAAEIVGEPVSPTESARLRAHPIAARGRRLRWAVGSVLLLAGVLALLGALLTDVLLHLAWICVLVGMPVAIALAVDAYRNLGHGITGDYLVTRHGAGSRHAVALQRGGVIGWTITSSPFQRRAGLITLAATTAANKGAYLIYDVDHSEGLAFAAEAVPSVLTQFLEPVVHPEPVSTA